MARPLRPYLPPRAKWPSELYLSSEKSVFVIGPAFTIGPPPYHLLIAWPLVEELFLRLNNVYSENWLYLPQNLLFVLFSLN